jgi:hypothetical protein
MDRPTERTLAARAVELGRGADPAALPELLTLLEAPSAETRRLAASAIGKLAGLADAPKAVAVLSLRLRDPHPQVRQYAVKALKAYGTAAESALADLRDIAANVSEKDYNRRDAALAVETISEALRMKQAGESHVCQKCGVDVAPDEYARAIRMFQRVYCDHCFDEVYIQRRNFDTRVEVQKTIRVSDGTLVQSDGERRIAEWLAAHKVAYRYDDRLRIIEGRQVRPDFHLPEYDVYIEYWGMDTLDYKIGMLLKQQMYQHAGKRLISLYPDDKPRLDAILGAKLLRLAPTDSAGAPSVPTPAPPAPRTPAPPASSGTPAPPAASGTLAPPATSGTLAPPASGVSGAPRSESAATPHAAPTLHPERTAP